MKSTSQLLVCSFILLPAAHVIAQEAKNDFFDLEVSADHRKSDNALRSSSDELKISETQNSYRADLGAHYENEWSQFVANYSVEKEVFQRNSQRDLTSLDGLAELTLGNAYQPLSLSLLHSRQSMLDTPDAVDLTDNRDTQEVFTISPAVKTHLSAVDSLMLLGSYTDISYKHDDLKKLEQKSMRLAWIHDLSKTDALQVFVRHMDASFKNSPQANYQLQAASVQYQVALKRFSYQLQAGYNKTETETTGKSFSAPSYAIDSTYTSGAHNFTLSLSQHITDTSLGGGNQSNFNMTDGVGSVAKGVGLDLINLRSANIGWTTTALCERCSFGFHASAMQQDYQELDEDGDERGVGANFKYSLSRVLSLSLRADHRKREFAAETTRSGFDSDEIMLSIDYEISKGLNLKVYVEQEKRKSDVVTQAYTENLTGLHLSYQF
jgi:hypothetical protein